LPILGVRGVRAALARRRSPVVAVSPVAGGRAVRGPLGGMLRARGLPVSPLGIAALYDGLLDALVIDFQDRRLRPRLEARGLRVGVTDIRMSTRQRSRAVARLVLELAEEVRREARWR
ncbi:MAG: 2-phospho-L-lactate transferase, partial [Candidatus Binatia bacterium]